MNLFSSEHLDRSTTYLDLSAFIKPLMGHNLILRVHITVELLTSIKSGSTFADATFNLPPAGESRSNRCRK